ncbi:hypothetical protein [Lacibacter sediminis]|uniref:DUF3108 domain-containing protein n=1 Tax=Lacibacter sediminis TaxID=2760713 RepID=A0A7G5XKK4_9BACT|nr:hypothetical protein [Lacibacter sediminis]QNA46007.1 hypothetical protein H4075_07430 [Lacibacter sediminis]
MQLRAFLFLFFLSFAFSTVAQNFTGVWEGSFYLRGKKKNKINVRIEITQKGDRLHGVVTTRGFQKNTAYGCDYIVSGWVEGNALVLGVNNVQRGVATTKADCGSFKRVELYPPENDSVSMAKGRWFWIDNSKEQFVVQKTGSEISEVVREEMNNIDRRPDPSRYIKLENEYLPYEVTNKNLGTYSVESKEIILVVSSLEEKARATMTVTLNDRTVFDNLYLSKNVLIIRLKDISKINNIDFINNSDTRFKLDVKISMQQGNDKKEWIVSIMPGGTAYLLLNRKD